MNTRMRMLGGLLATMVVVAACGGANAGSGNGGAGSTGGNGGAGSTGSNGTGGSASQPAGGGGGSLETAGKGEVLWSHDFNSYDEWTYAATEDGPWNDKLNKLGLELDAGRFAALPAGHNFGDVTITAEVTQYGGSDGWIGFGCRYNPGKPFWVAVIGNGQATLARLAIGPDGELVAEPEGFQESPTYVTRIVTLKCIGDRIDMSLKDTAFAANDNGSPMTGDLIFLGASKTSLWASIDEVKVTQE